MLDWAKDVKDQGQGTSMLVAVKGRERGTWPSVKQDRTQFMP